MGNFMLEGSRTSDNLAKAFAGESQARNRYLFYSEVAKDQGYPSLEEVFLQTADNERGHAEVFFTYMADGMSGKVLQPQVLVPTAKGATQDNLYYAAMGEYEEYSHLYPAFGQIAKEEGFEAIARSFFSIAEIEQRHFLRFQDLLDRYQNDLLYRSEQETVWECTNCGYRLTGTAAPKNCPACLHKKEFFKIVCESVL